MKAAVYHGRKDIRLEDIPEPVTRPGTVKIKVEWCGICGTDLHEFLEGPIVIPPRSKPHPLTGMTLPLVLGHEFSGQVVELGQGVTKVREGDRVAVEPKLTCGECPECRRGDTNLCRTVGFAGLSGPGGGFSEYSVVPESNAHQLGALPTDLGALVEPCAVGFHAVRKSGFRPGQTALVLGAGPIGCVTLQCLRAAGARQVVVAEVLGTRREAARLLGADAVVNPREADVVEEVRNLTAGRGADVTFEAAGVSDTLTTAIRATARGGTVVNIALWGGPAPLNMTELVHHEIALVGARAYANDHPATIALMSDGRVKTEPLVTGRIALDDIIEEGFAELIDHREEHMKILVRP